MATSYVQLLLLVLASLLFLPALFAVDFGYCNKNGYDYGNFSRVEISPNPVGPEDFYLNITVSGYASKQMNNVTIEVYAKSKKSTDRLGEYSICKMGGACVIKSGWCFTTDCSIEAGTKFVLPISEVIVGDLEDDFKCVVSLLEDDLVNSRDYDEKLIERMCVEFVVPVTASTLDSA
ncbi:MD-2-related lipid-recognition domain-containing protein [Hirschfeldia incana]|nr:MD-2-related lipid-recognition domain-containing protein [Hirschfeldia incana]